MLQKNCRLGGGFAKANILIYVGLRSAPPNLRLRLMHYFFACHATTATANLYFFIYIEFFSPTYLH
ncbi:MAG: hypothetical protein ACYTXE_24870, partial [Nostoc sp.]